MGGRGGWGTSPNIWQLGSVCDKKKKIQSALRFCKNEGSKRSKNKEKGGEIVSKIKEKIDTKCFKIVK